MIAPPVEIIAVSRRPAAPHRALWCGPWGCLLLIGDAQSLQRTVFQGPLPRAQAAADPLPLPWGEQRPLRLLLRGTDFQMSVWRALAELPFGTSVSYTDIAARIGRPRAIRAVASAVAANPVPMLLPCHRVIRRDGKTGHYIGGAARKRQLLDDENGHRSLSTCF